MITEHYDYRDGGKVFTTAIIDILKNNKVVNVLEVGSGKYPSLWKSFVEEYDLTYYVLDPSAEEIETLKAQNDYIKDYFVHDLTKPLNTTLQFDLVISKFVWEHIDGIDSFHKNINKLLAQGGFALHYFPCLSTLPFWVNAVLPDSWSEWFLNVIAKREKDKHPVFYQGCYGPTKNNIRKIKSIGFDIPVYHCLYGHNYYEKNFKPLHYLELLKMKLLLKFPNKRLCSYAMVVLKSRGGLLRLNN